MAELRPIAQKRPARMLPRQPLERNRAPLATSSHCRHTLPAFAARIAARAARMPAGTPRTRLVQRMTARVLSALSLGSGCPAGLPIACRSTAAPVHELLASRSTRRAPSAAVSSAAHLLERVQSRPVSTTAPRASAASAPASTRSPVRSTRGRGATPPPTPPRVNSRAGLPGLTWAGPPSVPDLRPDLPFRPLLASLGML